MNIRSFIGLKNADLSTVEDRNYDNPYTCKLDIWYGAVETPYHDTANFTQEELVRLIDSFEKVLGVFKAYRTAAETTSIDSVPL